MTEENAGQPVNAAVDTQPVQELATTETAESTEGVAPEGQEAPKEADKPDDVIQKLTSKLSKQDRRIGKYKAVSEQWKAEAARLQAELEQARSGLKQSASPKAQEAPLTMEQFQSPEEYIAAIAEQKARAIAAEALASQPKGKHTTKEDIQNLYAQAQESARLQVMFEQQAEAASKVIDDFAEVIDQGRDEELPEYVLDAIRHAENGALLAYYILKEDMVDDLRSLPPAKAVMALARAEAKALDLLKPKPVTKTPAPIKTNSGTASGGRKDWVDLDGEDFWKAYKSKTDYSKL